MQVDYWDMTDPEQIVMTEPWPAVNAEEQELTLHDSDATSDTYAVRSIVLENGQRNEDLSNGDPVIIEVTMPSNGCKK